MALRLLIVDDNHRFLSAARDLLEREGLTVVGVASTSADAVRYANELLPDVALVDIVLGEESGFDLAQRLAGRADAGRTAAAGRTTPSPSRSKSAARPDD